MERCIANLNLIRCQCSDSGEMNEFKVNKVSIFISNAYDGYAFIKKAPKKYQKNINYFVNSMFKFL